MSERPSDLTASGAEATTRIVPRRARPSLTWPGARVPAALIPVLWGGVFLAGGIAVWMTVPRPNAPLAPPWRAGADPSLAVQDLTSAVRGGAGEPDLLKLEWPAHPDARGYRLRFRDAAGHPRPPVTVESNVFLYDLKRDVLDLPESFQWEVSAILDDGSEVVAPPRTHTP
jgi:hypothetical protein